MASRCPWDEGLALALQAPHRPTAPPQSCSHGLCCSGPLSVLGHLPAPPPRGWTADPPCLSCLCNPTTSGGGGGGGLLRDHREAVTPGSQGVPAPVQRWEILSGADLKPTGRVCCSRKCPGSRPPSLGGREPILGSGRAGAVGRQGSQGSLEPASQSCLRTRGAGGRWAWREGGGWTGWAQPGKVAGLAGGRDSG